MTIGQLISKEIREGKQIRAGRGWFAFQHNGVREVWHYRALMATVQGGVLRVILRDAWGSQSDKCGMTKILAEARRVGLEVTG